MMRSLLKISDNRRDQGTKTHYMDRRKLDLIDQLTHAPQMPLMHRDYPKTRAEGSGLSSRRAKSNMSHGSRRSGMSGMSQRSVSSMGGSRGRLPPLKGAPASRTHPAVNMFGPAVDRPQAFYDKLQAVDPAYLAKVHKNMQEKVYTRFKNAREAFRRFDLDHSGAIDFYEFKTVLGELELIGKETSNQIEALFHVCDESGNGQISYQDFCKWIKAPDWQENLMVRRETPYKGQRGGMSYGQRAGWIQALGVLCE